MQVISNDRLLTEKLFRVSYRE